MCGLGWAGLGWAGVCGMWWQMVAAAEPEVAARVTGREGGRPGTLPMTAARRLAAQVCEAYQRYKKIHGRYDNPDVVSHVYRQLAEQGYHGVTIHSLYR